jgi:glutathione S-transferase
LQPSIMPKPDMQALTGGYRRIPILQIGADIYCDTALICDVLEARQPQPSLYPSPLAGQARIVAQWADSTVFAAAMAYNFAPAGAAYFFRDASPAEAAAFAEDRKAMRGGGARMFPGEATIAYAQYLARLNDMLANQEFLLGNAPTLADFSVYHSLWFTQAMPPIATIFDAAPRIAPWLARMNAFSAQGRALMQKSSAHEALALATASTPEPVVASTFVDTHGIALGSEVSVTADSFGLESTTGTLIGATAQRLTLARHDPRVGLVHVHFPRLGFVLRKA